MRLVVWNADEVHWLSAALLLAALLAGLTVRLTQLPWRRGLAIVGLAALAVGTMLLSPVPAELAGSALTGVLLAVLLPQRFLVLTRPGQSDPPRNFLAGQMPEPPESTQSFIPIAGLMLALVGSAWGLSAWHEETPAPPTNGRPAGGDDQRRENRTLRKTASAKSAVPKDRRTIIDVLIPVRTRRQARRRRPARLRPPGLMGRLKELARGDELPAYLIAASNFDGTGGRISPTARLGSASKFTCLPGIRSFPFTCRWEPSTWEARTPVSWRDDRILFYRVREGEA